MFGCCVRLLRRMKMKDEMMEKLRAPFPLAETKWRVMNTTKDGKKGTCAYYIDARNVMDRMDEVFGDRWSSSYRVLSGEVGRAWVVECTIFTSFNNDRGTIEHTDVGLGEDAKEAYSDALK